LVIHIGKAKKKSQFSCTATKKDKAGSSVLPKSSSVYFELFWFDSGRTALLFPPFRIQITFLFLFLTVFSSSLKIGQSY